MKRWRVYKDGKDLGLKTAKDIRKALREGTIDPFDLVSAEGSNIKSELVEVDEIFREDTGVDHAPGGATSTQMGEPSQSQSKSQPQIDISEASPPEPEGGQAPKQQPKPATESRQKEEVKEPKPVSQKEVPKTEAPQTEVPREISKSPSDSSKKKRSSTLAPDKKKSKQFYLIDDKKRVLGPVSAEEIQSLYRRGILSNSVKVQKSEQGKKVPVRQFIASYSGKRMKALADKANPGKAGNPSSKVLNEMYQVMNSKRLVERKAFIPGLSVALLGAFLGFGLFFFLDFDPSTPSAPNQSAVEQEVDEPKKSVRKRPSQVKKKPKLKRTPAEKDKPKPKRQAKKPKPKPKPPEPAPVRTAPAERRPPPTPAPRATRRTEPSRQAAVRRTSRPANRGIGPIKKAMGKAGQVVTVGPLTYNPVELEACGLKCQLKFSDGQGGVLEAVFFKGAYYERLKAKPNGVTLTGSSKIQRGTLVIFIQDVR
ncbi:hypothetical protein [Pseudobacteriovorax antillogorgiicola]|uniref:GYF domain-containing protein n=1 Tax=Pseudobacteriovorax antillogorgiicola TaxID=1513793 RepID=A0A1Y6CBX7_9BACT|nr:hypothetical protein [Pseudobacteriovorax antillogorgiicola]TCS49395.1 hypothetical protein EDD56_11575 [Pseudobacteriovorax antillogorgiicola]SMF47139.1 hypothetical protein SAMN06296036_114109 [Pseudobacteriovorax antillogorgiicola]